MKKRFKVTLKIDLGYPGHTELLMNFILYIQRQCSRGYKFMLRRESSRTGHSYSLSFYAYAPNGLYFDIIPVRYEKKI